METSRKLKTFIWGEHNLLFYHISLRNLRPPSPTWKITINTYFLALVFHDVQKSDYGILISESIFRLKKFPELASMQHHRYSSHGTSQPQSLCPQRRLKTHTEPSLRPRRSSYSRLRALLSHGCWAASSRQLCSADHMLPTSLVPLTATSLHVTMTETLPSQLR